MKLELKHQDTYGKTFFQAIYMIYFSHTHHTEKAAIQVCTSPFQINTVNDDTTR
jgi:hypothetical protein